MKKIILLTVSILCAISLCACGRENQKIEKKKELEIISAEENVEKQKEPEVIEIGETVTVSTDYGDYEIAVIGAAETDWDKSGYANDLKDHDETTYPASIRFEVKNVSYSGLYEGKMCGYDLANDGSIVIMDSEGFKLEFYDISGSSDGEYAVSADTPIGTKAKVSYPFVVPNDESELTIVIGNRYKVIVDIDRTNIVTTF